MKLHLGCGTQYKEGWVNIDDNSDNNISKLDINMDLTLGLPYQDGTVDYIFHEHFFEHLTPEQGKLLVKECMRVLKIGGVMRIATPDLVEAVDKYLNMEIKDDPIIKRYQLHHVKTKAERLNMAFSAWGHKWLYDWEELERRLREAGCKVITQCKLRQSKHDALKGIEVRDNSNLIAEVTKH